MVFSVGVICSLGLSNWYVDLPVESSGEERGLDDERKLVCAVCFQRAAAPLVLEPRRGRARGFQGLLATFSFSLGKKCEYVSVER